MADNNACDRDREVVEIEEWKDLFELHESFLNALECIGEMQSLVLPVLKSRDAERQARMSEIAERLDEKDGTAFRLRSIEDAREFMGHVRKVKQSDKLFRRGIIISIVSMFDGFFAAVLRISFKNNLQWLCGSDRKLSYKELLEIESLEKFKEDLVEREIDALMRDSHFDQILFLDSKLKIGIQSEFPSWRQFLEITERRNLFVHAGGTVSRQYLANCEQWGIPLPDSIHEGRQLAADEEYIQSAVDCFFELSVRVVHAAARRMFPECLD